MCGLPRTLEVLVSMPSKQDYEEHGEREEKEKGKEEEGKVEEEEEDHLHHYFIIFVEKLKQQVILGTS